MAIKRNKIAKQKTKNIKLKLVKSSRKKIKTKSKVRRKMSATTKRLNKSIKKAEEILNENCSPKAEWPSFLIARVLFNCGDV